MVKTGPTGYCHHCQLEKRYAPGPCADQQTRFHDRSFALGHLWPWRIGGVTFVQFRTLDHVLKDIEEPYGREPEQRLSFRVVMGQPVAFKNRLDPAVGQGSKDGIVHRVT